MFSCNQCGRNFKPWMQRPIRCCNRIYDDGQQSIEEPERIIAVRIATARKHRLIAWLIFFRRQSDRGVGDTAERMFLQSDDRDIKALLKRLLSSCNCRTEDAAPYLNKQYPYAERTQP